MSLNPREWPTGEGPGEHIRNALSLLQWLDCDTPDAREGLPAIKAAVIERLRRADAGLKKRNPTLALVNPAGLQLMASGVYSIEYKHQDDGRDYEHVFERWDDIRLGIVDDYRVLIFSSKVPIIGMFEVED